MTTPWAIFWVALVVRLVYITAAHSYRFHALDDHFEFGWEAGRVGRSLALGHGFADPFIPIGTGPTAWLPPLYPLVIGAVFRVFGIYTQLSGWVLLALNSLCGAATIPAIYEIALRCFGAGDDAHRGRRIALWSAWIWALYPATMQYSVRWIWEMSLTTMLFAWVLVVALRLRGVGGVSVGRSRAGLWIGFGVLWGMIALSNATPLLFLPVCGIWVVAGMRDKREAFAGAALAAILFLACAAPWAWRNWQVFHAFIPVRGNFGAELHMGNSPGANGFPWGITIFSQPDLERYTTIGEVAFVRERGQLAMGYIRAHPERFMSLSLERVYFYWVNVPHPPEKRWLLEFGREAVFCLLSITGWLGLLLAIRQRIPGTWLFVAAFVLIPVTYYFVTAGARFRHPLEPIIVILTVNLFASAELTWSMFFQVHR